MEKRQCLSSDGLSLSRNNNLKERLQNWKEKCQRSEINTGMSTDFSKAVSARLQPF